MDILTLGDEQLRQKAEAIAVIGPEYKKIAAQMLELLREGKGIGLAGPQVGLMKRIFVVKIDKDIPRVFINPSILETSQEQSKVEEGCLSIPGFWADVIRPERIKLQAWNEKGKPFTLEGDGLLARVILHELDHLEGILFIDRLSEQKRKKILAQYEKRKQA